MKIDDDITGETYGNLHAIRRLTRGLWLCKCDCGAYCSVPAELWGIVKTCGCSVRKPKFVNVREYTECKNPAFVNPTGNKFGDLTVIGRDRSAGQSKWMCKCDCGNIVSVSRMDLVAGRVTSCGACDKFRQTNDTSVTGGI